MTMPVSFTIPYSIIKTVFVFLLFTFLSQLGVTNQFLQCVVLLVVVWPLFMFFDHIARIIKSEFITKLLFSFIETTPLIFSAIFLSVAVQSMMTGGIQDNNLINIDYTIFYICYFLVLVLHENLPLLTKKLERNEKMSSFFNGILKQRGIPIFEGVGVTKIQGDENYLRALREAAGIIMTIASVTLMLIIGALIIVLTFTVGDKNIPDQVTALLPLTGASFSFGIIQLIYSYRTRWMIS